MKKRQTSASSIDFNLSQAESEKLLSQRILSAMSDYERQERSRRIKRGLAARKRN